MSGKSKSKEITVQRDILGLLAAKSTEKNAAIDIDKALQYPLAPVPLSLATCEGIRRNTAKSKLMDAALQSILETEGQSNENQGSLRVYILDLAAYIRSMVKVANTFSELALQVLNDIPKNYSIIYIACDTYRDRSIKNSERCLRGNSDKFVIRSGDVRVRSDFNKFLRNGDNKERLFEIIEEVWTKNATQLGEQTVFFGRGNTCVKMTSQSSVLAQELETDHEEADTKIAYMIKHASENNNDPMVCVVHSSSGDTDIRIILLCMDELQNINILIDYGSGRKEQKVATFRFMQIDQGAEISITRYACLYRE
eukprot:gene20780-biopygen14596